MARIPYFDPTHATGRAAAAYAKLPALNIFRMMGHGGDLIEVFSRMGAYLLNFTSLDPILREIAIVRVGVVSNAGYEIYQHEAISRRIGMSNDIIAGIHEGPSAAVFDDAQREVMAFTDDVVFNVRASDATFEPIRPRWGDKALQDLTITIGFYMMVSRYLETFDVDIEVGEAPVVTVAGDRT
jgi:4-carboxymuconolactone decarboxylase